MNTPTPYRPTIVKDNLDAIHRRWKWLTFGRQVGIAGTVCCAFWFLVQLSGQTHLLSQQWLFYTLVTFALLGSMLTFTILALVALASQEKPTWLAAALEKGSPGMLDRVNTLVHLDSKPRGQRLPTFRRRIEQQAAEVFTQEKIANPFPTEPTLIPLGVFALALAGVIYFQIHANPFAKLFEPVAALAPAKPESAFELAANNVTETREKKAWGEVRIVAPGRDVKLSKIDVLQLQIEMAASQPLQNPEWLTSINGEPEVVHALEVPGDPNYGAFQPLLYLDELKVAEWDVVSYYARVQTAAPASYASKMYFIEIRPFREDILKEAGSGGKSGKCYSLLSEITGLIKRQGEILQQTHVHQQTVYPQDELRLQDTKKLTAAEEELSLAINHLFGKVVAANENADIAEILDQLTNAEQQATLATAALRDDVIVEGKQRELAALAALVASRKAFKKVISDNPDAFGSGSGKEGENEDLVTAESTKKILSQVSEMHDRDKATLTKLHDLVTQQKALPTKPESEWHEGQLAVKDQLHRMIKDNPDLFRDTAPEQTAVQENMTKALADDASRDLIRTGESMGDLEKAVQKNHEAQQMAQAYALKKVIDQNIKQLEQEQAKPGSLSSEEAKSISETAKGSTATLKEIAESGGGSGFGPELGKALSAENKQALDEALQQFGEGQDAAARGTSTVAAQQGLSKVSKAFEQSQPTLTKQVRGQDQLQAPKGDALDQALQQIQSLILAKENHRPATPEEEAKAEAEILHNLEEGLKDPKGDLTPSKSEVMGTAKQLLQVKSTGAADPAALKRLLDQIEAVRIEANDPNHAKTPEAQTTFVDPAKYPPTYRERIKTYFEELSGHTP